uniref:DIX domain-containing protein n=1 Tax=Pseudonaja textilis TaxID=8673 RepID=A0A670ZC80_PSETE
MATAGGGPQAAEMKVIYHLDEEETPYLVEIAVPAERLNLGHVKATLARPGAKYFFKSMDQDFREQDPLLCLSRNRGGSCKALGGLWKPPLPGTLGWREPP